MKKNLQILQDLISPCVLRIEKKGLLVPRDSVRETKKRERMKRTSVEADRFSN